LEAKRDKFKITYKGKLTRMTAYFSTDTLKARMHVITYFKPYKKITANLDYCIQISYPS
jgi:hypothetical protein